MSLDLNYIVADNGQTTASATASVLQSATITTSGFPVQIIVTGDGEPAGAGWHRLQIFRDSTPISEISHIETTGEGINMTVALSAIDQPIAGTYTYSVKIVATSMVSVRYTEVGQLFMSIEEKVVSTHASLSWLRREITPPDLYYGYNKNINASDSDKTWSIKKVSSSGSVESVNWNDSSTSSFNASWDDRVENFEVPSGNLGFTHSGGTFYWNLLTGVNKYDIIVKNNDGFLVTRLGDILNNTGYTITEGYYNKTSHAQYLNSGSYSVVLEAKNSAGTLSATYSVQI